MALFVRQRKGRNRLMIAIFAQQVPGRQLLTRPSDRHRDIKTPG